MKTEKKQSRLTLPKTALPRIYKIDKKIASGTFPNANELAKTCETSISTISRDVEFMKDQLFAPIEYDAQKRGYYYLEKTFRLPAGFTTAEDLLALSMAKSIFSLYRETPLYEVSNNLLKSILTPIASGENHDWLENRIVVPKIASAKVDTSVWETVVSGLKENRIITFDYRGKNDQKYQNRRVRPFQLLFDTGIWYLYGFSEERKAIRIFSLSRIKNIVLLKDSFSLPPNFDYSVLSGDSYFGIFIGLEKMQFSIDCYDDAAADASERQWAGDQKISEIDGGVTIKFNSTQYEKVLKWVLSHGCNAVPRKPKQLVDAWKWQVSEMFKSSKKI